MTDIHPHTWALSTISNNRWKFPSTYNVTNMNQTHTEQKKDTRDMAKIRNVGWMEQMCWANCVNVLITENNVSELNPVVMATQYIGAAHKITANQWKIYSLRLYSVWILLERGTWCVFRDSIHERAQWKIRILDACDKEKESATAREREALSLSLREERRKNRKRKYFRCCKKKSSLFWHWQYLSHRL